MSFQHSFETLIGTKIDHVNLIIIMILIYLVVIITDKIIQIIQRDNLTTIIGSLLNEFNTYNQLLVANLDYLSQFDYMTVRGSSESSSGFSGSSNMSDSSNGHQEEEQEHQNDSGEEADTECATETDKKND